LMVTKLIPDGFRGDWTALNGCQQDDAALEVDERRDADPERREVEHHLRRGRDVDTQKVGGERFVVGPATILDLGKPRADGVSLRRAVRQKRRDLGLTYESH